MYVEGVLALCRETGSGEGGVLSSHKVVETTVHTVKTVGGTVSESKTTTVEELKTVEGIITSCMETTSSTSTSAAAETVAGIENVSKSQVSFLVVVIADLLLIALDVFDCSSVVSLETRIVL